MVNDKGKNIIIVILIVLLVSMSIVAVLALNGTISLNGEIKDDTTVEEDKKDEEEEFAESYTIDDVSEKVYGGDPRPVSLILWNDGTFDYSNDITKEYGVGRYSVLQNKIYLDFLFAEVSNSDNKLVVSNLKKELSILSIVNITDGVSKVELQDGDVTLVTLNQPARSGEDFCTSLNEVLNNC